LLKRRKQSQPDQSDFDSQQEQHVDDGQRLTKETQQDESVASEALSARLQAVMDRQTAQQNVPQKSTPQRQSKPAVAPKIKDKEPDEVQEADAGEQDHPLVSTHDTILKKSDEEGTPDVSAELEMQTRRIVDTFSTHQRRSRRHQATPSSLDLRDIAHRMRQEGTEFSPVGYEDDGFEDIASWNDDYENDAHPHQSMQEQPEEEAILFSIPNDLYGKLRKPGRLEILTSHDLADNASHGNGELSELLNDNFDYIDSFLQGADYQETGSIFVSSMGNERGQDVAVDVIREYAVQVGIRPVLITLSNQSDRYESIDRSSQHAHRDEADLDGSVSGLQEYDDYDVIRFVANQSLSVLDDGIHWSTRALESEHFAHLLELCKQSYGMVLIVAPKDQPQEEMDDVLDLFDATIVVLQQPDLDDQDLLDWQEWASETNGALILDCA
jgi:hypothetical protein